MRTFLAVLVAMSFTATAFAAEPAKAPAKEPAKVAEPVKAEPAKAEPAKVVAVKAEDCDCCKAHMAVMKAGKPTMTKLDNGQMMTITADAKGMPALKKAMGEMETAMKGAMAGTAKLDEQCIKMTDAMKAGKVMMGHGEIKDGFASATLSSDPEMVKGMHEMMDKMAAPAPKAAAKK